MLRPVTLILKFQNYFNGNQRKNLHYWLSRKVQIFSIVNRKWWEFYTSFERKQYSSSHTPEHMNFMYLSLSAAKVTIVCDQDEHVIALWLHRFLVWRDSSLVHKLDQNWRIFREYFSCTWQHISRTIKPCFVPSNPLMKVQNCSHARSLAVKQVRWAIDVTLGTFTGFYVREMCTGSGLRTLWLHGAKYERGQIFTSKLHLSNAGRNCIYNLTLVSILRPLSLKCFIIHPCRKCNLTCPTDVTGLTQTS